MQNNNFIREKVKRLEASKAWVDDLFHDFSNMFLVETVDEMSNARSFVVITLNKRILEMGPF